MLPLRLSTSLLFHFRSASFRPLLFRFRLLSLCFFLSSCFPFPPHSGFLGAPFRSRFLGFPRSFRPSFPCLLSRFFVLSFLFVSFRPSLIRSHSCSSGAYLVLSLSVYPHTIRSLSFPSLPVPATQPLLLPFLFLPVFPLAVGLLRCSLPLSLLGSSPFFPT